MARYLFLTFAMNGLSEGGEKTGKRGMHTGVLTLARKPNTDTKESLKPFNTD